MNLARFSVWVIMLIGVVLVLTISTTEGATYDPDVDPDRFYLFNDTTRRYEDILQWGIETDTVWVEMRVEDGIARYEFEDKKWAKLYLDDTLKVTSTYNISEQDDKSGVWKTKTISPVKWIFIDHGETLELCREMKGSEEALNESWVFYFKMGSPPKITFNIEELKVVKANRTFEWILKFSSGYVNKTVASSSLTVTRTVLNNVIIDWSDFGKTDINVTSNNSTSEYILNFHPQGSLGNITIDPSVSFSTPRVVADRSWIVIGCINTNNAENPSEVLNWELFDWWFINNDLTATYPIDCNPYPVDPNIASANVQFFDMWGRSPAQWKSAYFGTGAAGTYTYIEVDLPVCWISVRTSDMIRDHDAFHVWTISDGVNTVTIDENIKFPVVVDDVNPVNWVVQVIGDQWIAATGTETVNHADLVSRREYVVYFNVSMITQPTTVWLRMYDNTTGQGIPWETFLVYVDGDLTPTDIIQGWTGTSYTVVVKDFFGNELYNLTDYPDDAPLYLWKIPLPIYSVKLHNQDPDYVHKIGLLWQGAGDPHEFYIAPYETEEKWLFNGSYQVRWTPYHWYVAQSTQAFTLVVTEANYFLINGTTISRIVTDVAGVYALQQVITNFVTPDVLWDIECPPLVPTSLDSDMDTRWVHPYAITRATVKQVISNTTSGTLWLPHPDRDGRNYNIIEDFLYIAGTYSTRIIINYTGNGTERFNYSYNPGFIDFGNIEGNYNIWSNNSCTFTRVTTWKEFDLFYWLYRPNDRKYTKTLWVNNTQNRTWTDVRWFVGFAESSTIDIDGVKITDNDNSINLVRGENYDVSVGGISMMFTTINASQKRSFSFTCWDYNASETLSAPMILLVDEDRKQYENRGYYRVTGSWTNSYALPYSGPLYLSIKVEGTIDPSSVIVVDLGASSRLSGDSFTIAGNTIIIILDSVEPGDAAAFDVFYNKQQDEGRLDIFTPLVGQYGSLYMIIVLVSLVGLIFLSYKVKGSERRQSYIIASVTYILGLAMVGIMHFQGVI